MLLLRPFFVLELDEMAKDTYTIVVIFGRKAQQDCLTIGRAASILMPAVGYAPI